MYTVETKKQHLTFIPNLLYIQITNEMVLSILLNLAIIYNFKINIIQVKQFEFIKNLNIIEDYETQKNCLQFYSIFA